MSHNLKEIIKQAILNIDLSSEDSKAQILIASKLCDIAIKIQKLDIMNSKEENFENYKFNAAEISIIEDYIRNFKNNLPNK